MTSLKMYTPHHHIFARKVSIFYRLESTGQHFGGAFNYVRARRPRNTCIQGSLWP